jgi:hypothetical protein
VNEVPWLHAAVMVATTVPLGELGAVRGWAD